MLGALAPILGAVFFIALGVGIAKLEHMVEERYARRRRARAAAAYARMRQEVAVERFRRGGIGRDAPRW